MTKKSYGFYGTLDVTGSSTFVSESIATVEKVITFEGTSRGADNLQSIELDDKDVVEVELDHITLIMSVEELKEYSKNGEVRSGVDDQPMLPTSIQSHQGATRGPVGVAIRVLRVLGVDVVGKAIEIAAHKVEGWLDDSGPGLYKVAKSGKLLQQGWPDDNKEVLLLIHGTASATARAFGSILPSADSDKTTLAGRESRWNELYEKFDGRVYALEHRTLTETPIANILMLLDTWPVDGGPDLVLLSHSRGGIVGDYLSCLYEWEQQPPELVAALDEHSSERKSLDKLDAMLASIPVNNRPRVLRHVRVGAPSAGTSLASKKTHIWLSVLSGMAAGIPGIGAGASALGDIAAAVVKEGLEPGALPGIDAQKNQSPFILSSQFYQSSHTELLSLIHI